MSTPPTSHRVLLLDREEVLRDVFGSYLAQKGCKVFASATPEEARNLLSLQKIDVLILDSHSRTDGQGDLLRLIARQEQLKIVLLVAGFDNASSVHAAAEGIDAVFCKPFGGRAVLQTLRELLTPPDGFSRDTYPIRTEVCLKAGSPFESAQLLALTPEELTLQTQSRYLPNVHERVQYRLHLTDGQAPIEGTGAVQWVNLSAHSQQSAEFNLLSSYLSETDRLKLSDYLTALKKSAA